MTGRSSPTDDVPDAAARRRALETGIAHQSAGGLAEAAAIYQAVLAQHPDDPDALHLLGTTERRRGNLAEAERLIRTALARQPNFPAMHNSLGNVLRDQGRLADSVDCFRRALALQPDFAQAYENLGGALVLLGRLPEAITALTRAIELTPQSAEAHNALGVALNRAGRLDDAIPNFRRAIALDPRHAQAHNNLGQTFGEQGARDAALACFRQALAVKPDYAGAHSNVIYALESDPSIATAESQAERRRWYLTHRKPRDAARGWANGRDPDRRLRVGYVSADFRRHSAAFTFSPVLWHHDRKAFEVTCYSAVAVEDQFTARFRQAANHWRTTHGLSDERLAEQIRADGIDLLVDLSGHTAGNRLQVFTLKPAPVQITAWAGPGTGIAEIDYLLSDPVVTPLDERALLAEQVVDLPCAFAFLPPDDTPAVAAAPAARGGPVTFGCFNRFSKVSDAALAAWAEILRATPDSRLMLKDKVFDEASVRNRVTATFAGHGIDAARLVFRGWTDQAQHLASYGEIDLALDPFPHGGGVTSLDALWMGVPVVTRLGVNQTGRTTAAILTALGLTALIAPDDAHYVALARARAADRGWLVTTRAALRPRMAASPIGNATLYAAAVEKIYRDVWRRWCAGRVTDPR